MVITVFFSEELKEDEVKASEDTYCNCKYLQLIASAECNKRKIKGSAIKQEERLQTTPLALQGGIHLCLGKFSNCREACERRSLDGRPTRPVCFAFESFLSREVFFMRS